MYCSLVINGWNIYISNLKYLHEDCDKAKKLKVAGAATACCFKKRLQNVPSSHVLAQLPKEEENILPNVTYSPNHRQADDAMINIRSTIRTAPVCVKLFTAVLFGNDVNSYTF